MRLGAAGFEVEGEEGKGGSRRAKREREDSSIGWKRIRAKREP